MTFERLLARDFLDHHGGRKGYVYASKASLAGEIARSERTVKRHLSRLRRLKLISRDPVNPLKIHLQYEQFFRLAAKSRRVSALPALAVSCPSCRRPFLRRRSNQRYCSQNCRKRTWKRKQKGASSNRRLWPHNPSPETSRSHEALGVQGGQRGDALGGMDVPPSNTRRLSTKRRRYDDHDVSEVNSEYVRKLKHPKLQDLCRRQGQLRRLCEAFSCDRVLRAIRQADLQYPPSNGIHNAYGLIYAMCRDGPDDTLLRAREQAERRWRQQEERRQRLRELQERGCLRCGFWDVGFDGYCHECRSFKNAGISTKGGSDPPLMVFDSAALEVEAASRPGSSTGVPPATLITHGGR